MIIGAWGSGLMAARLMPAVRLQPSALVVREIKQVPSAAAPLGAPPQLPVRRIKRIPAAGTACASPTLSGMLSTLARSTGDDMTGEGGTGDGTADPDGIGKATADLSDAIADPTPDLIGDLSKCGEIAALLKVAGRAAGLAGELGDSGNDGVVCKIGDRCGDVLPNGQLCSSGNCAYRVPSLYIYVYTHIYTDVSKYMPSWATYVSLKVTARATASAGARKIWRVFARNEFIFQMSSRAHVEKDPTAARGGGEGSEGKESKREDLKPKHYEDFGAGQLGYV